MHTEPGGPRAWDSTWLSRPQGQTLPGVAMETMGYQNLERTRECAGKHQQGVRSVGTCTSGLVRPHSHLGVTTLSSRAWRVSHDQYVWLIQSVPFSFSLPSPRLGLGAPGGVHPIFLPQYISFSFSSFLFPSISSPSAYEHFHSRFCWYDTRDRHERY